MSRIERRRRPGPPTVVGRAALAGALEVALLVAAGGPTAAATVGPATTAGALQVLPLNTQLWVGAQPLVVDLRDGRGLQLDPRAITAAAALTDPTGSTRAMIPLAPIQLIPNGPWWMAGDVTLDTIGTWTLEVESTAAGRDLVGRASLAVQPDGGTPPLGAIVTPIRTPTLASSGYHLARITTDPEPEAQFYWTSVDEALAAGRPFVLAIDSVGIVTSDACGGAVEHLRHLKTEFPGLLLIHAEPWIGREQDGRLLLDPPGGPPRPAPWSRAWGVTSAPWMFVVDGDGRLRAKLNDVFGSDELRAAVREIAPWAPGGH